MSATKDGQEVAGVRTEVRSWDTELLKGLLQVAKCFAVGSLLLAAVIGFGWVLTFLAKFLIMREIFAFLALAMIPTLIGAVILNCSDTYNPYLDEDEL